MERYGFVNAYCFSDYITREKGNGYLLDQIDDNNVDYYYYPVFDSYTTLVMKPEEIPGLLIGQNIKIYNKEYEVDVKFYCHCIHGIYQNVEEFYEDNPSMAEESYIPVGAFPADFDNKDWKPSPMNYINSTVDEVVDNALVGAPENFVLFYGKAEGTKLDQILFFQKVEEKEKVEPGYTVSGTYWAELQLIIEGGIN